MIIKRQ